MLQTPAGRPYGAAESRGVGQADRADSYGCLREQSRQTLSSCWARCSAGDAILALKLARMQFRNCLGVKKPLWGACMPHIRSAAEAAGAQGTIERSLKQLTPSSSGIKSLRACLWYSAA